MTVLELKEACEELIEMFSPEASVTIQFLNEDLSIRETGKCVAKYRDDKGNLYLLNRELKNNK